MTDEVNIKKMPHKKLFAMLAAVVLIAGGITLTSVSVANANAEETARLCAVATESSTSIAASAKASLGTADSALVAVTVLDLPDGAGTTTEYAAVPAVEAVEAVTAVGASEGVEAVAGVEAVPARDSGAEVAAVVTAARMALAKIKIVTECTTRDQAAAITSKTRDTTKATKALDTRVETLLADFTTFQSNEAARIAAEVEAARVAAEIEAARVAAEAEAARVAAEAAAAEAARVAANAAAKKSTYSGSSGSDGGSYIAPAPAPSGGGSSTGGTYSGPPNGGQVGPGTGGSTGCLTSNGMGGSMPC
jgi:hypothetical protein